MDESSDILCLFSAEVRREEGSYVVEIPEREVDLGSLDADDVYRFGAFPAPTPAPDGPPDASADRDPEQDRQRASTGGPSGGTGPPVAAGEERTVDIETLGDQGDGIARVGPGYVLIVPDTEVGERVVIEVTDVRDTVGFAEVVERKDYYE